MPRQKHQDAGGRPDDGAADQRDDGHQDHQKPPDQRPLNVRHQKDDPPQHPLDAADDQRYLQRRARRHDEPFVEQLLPPHPQRKNLHRHPEEPVPVADEEKERVEHDCEFDQQAEGVLRQIRQVDEDVFRDPLHHFGGLRNQHLLVDVEQLGDGIAGDRVDQVLEIPVHVLRVGAQGCVGPDGFVEDERSDDPRRQQDDQRDQEKENRRTQVRAVQFPVDPEVERSEDAGDDGGPKDREEKGLQKVEEKDRHHSQDDEERDIVLFHVSHRFNASRGLSPKKPDRMPDRLY